MDAELRLQQADLCRKYGSPVVITPSSYKVGLADGVGKVPGIINGLRHPAIAATAGWYFWPNQELSGREDFFKPYHAGHLLDIAPAVVKFLSLAPGWRFLVDERTGYEDVWFDPQLLKV